MNTLKIGFYLSIIATFAISTVSLSASFRIVDGTNIDTVKRFPHHVTIHPGNSEDGFAEKLCSGSILNEQWIITALSCIDQDNEFRLDFERLYFNESTDSLYSVLVDKSYVTPYPTMFDDIALIRLPVSLIFTDYIKPINLFHDKEYSEDGQFAVMAGFGEDKYKLTYGMFETYPCQDEYLQFCTKPWGAGSQIPCQGNEGGGLVIGWPSKPELIGIFSNPKGPCDKNTPAVFTRVSRYYQWIMQVIGQTNTPTPTIFYKLNMLRK